jgi:hypothetical protein
LKSNKSLLSRGRGLLAGTAVAAAALLCIAATAPAATLSGDSSTYLLSRETMDSDKILGAYEYLDFDVQNIGSETISFHTGGWLRYDLQDEEFGKKTNNDLQYAYLNFRAATDNTTVKLGRVMVFEGAAAERVDGIYARTDLLYGFGISAFGGTPVETGSTVVSGSTDGTENDLIYGGRISHEKAGLYRVGLSLLREERDGEAVRKEEGFDLWLQPMNKVELTGSSKYNVMESDWKKLEGAKTSDWANHSYVLTLGSFGPVRLITTETAINYKNYFTAATMSAFTFRPDILDPEEKVNILGETVAWDASDSIKVSLDYKAFSYDIAGNAKYVGGTVKYIAASGAGGGLSLHTMSGETDRLKYSEYRVYGFKKIDKTDLVVDVLDVKYSAPINGVSDAVSVSLAAQYDLSEKLKIGADVEYSKNPDFDKDVRAFLKAIYRFGAGEGV